MILGQGRAEPDLGNLSAATLLDPSSSEGSITDVSLCSDICLKAQVKKSTTTKPTPDTNLNSVCKLLTDNSGKN